ncbi:hypothetical protein [Streptomyces sp. BPSDS2]|uniref:hypothetical protein n=1 Tax=Streptomyces sp. BPSDS2 TaxID=2571021 RepID=UPI0010C17A54|nr:hypothetical protein [Streptomyces sp. BPSDS2]
MDHELTPQTRELLPAPTRRELPAIPMYDEAAALLLAPKARSLAEELIAMGRVRRYSPEARALFVGQMRSGKANALDLTRAHLDAAGIPYEESEDTHGQTTIRTRPAGAESPQERP